MMTGGGEQGAEKERSSGVDEDAGGKEDGTGG